MPEIIWIPTDTAPRNTKQERQVRNCAYAEVLASRTRAARKRVDPFRHVEALRRRKGDRPDRPDRSIKKPLVIFYNKHTVAHVEERNNAYATRAFLFPPMRPADARCPSLPSRRHN